MVNDHRFSINMSMKKSAPDCFTKQLRNREAHEKRCKHINKKPKQRSVRKTDYDMLPEKIKQLRPHNFRYADYDYISAKAQQYGIKSQRQYRIFVKYYEPAGFPSAPDRAYFNEWIDWNAFLRTDNRYYGNDTLFKLVPYWDAVAKVQPLKLTSQIEYEQAFENGKFPVGVPKNPHKRYHNFIKNGGWRSYLGKSMIDKINAQQSIQQACALVYTKDQSPNVISLVVALGGVTDLLEKLNDAPHLQVVKVYNWYPENGQDILGLLDALGTKQSEFTWLFHNPNEVYYELQGILEPLSY